MLEIRARELFGGIYSFSVLPVAASDSRAPAVTKLGRPAGPTFFLTHSRRSPPAGFAAARLPSTPPRQRCWSLSFALTPFLANNNNNVLRNGLPV
ncbi:unnamed protein product [Sphagnum troendelagicum]|uniref:Uncharacterized protein n=1 Tax=Sphagnum jensenii TaxID=128206 RepID=A0ABP0WT25_9BRYO